MGNLCSSGTDITDKKEESKTPDVKEGENEAQLLKYAPLDETNPDCGQVVVVDGGGGDDGMSARDLKTGGTAPAEGTGSGDAELQCVATRSQPAFTEVADNGSADVQNNALDIAVKVENVAKVVVVEGDQSWVNGMSQDADRKIQVFADGNKISTDLTDVQGDVFKTETEGNAASRLAAEKLNDTFPDSPTTETRSGANLLPVDASTTRPDSELSIEDRRNVEGYSSNLELEIEDALLNPISGSQDGVFTDVQQWIEEKFSEAKATAFCLNESSENAAGLFVNKEADNNDTNASEIERNNEEAVQQNWSDLRGSNSANNECVDSPCKETDREQESKGDVDYNMSVQAECVGQSHFDDADNTAQTASVEEHLPSGQEREELKEHDSDQVPLYQPEITNALTNYVKPQAAENNFIDDELVSSVDREHSRINDNAAAVAYDISPRVDDNTRVVTEAQRVGGESTGQEMEGGCENLEHEKRCEEDALIGVFNEQQVAGYVSNEILQTESEQPDEQNILQGQRSDAGDNLLDTAISLFENQSSVPGTEVIVERSSKTEDTDHEATAREFVESIVEKAALLVSEGQNEALTNASAYESGPSTERGEETIEPKLRGVILVSPQVPEKSVCLSAAPELPHPPYQPESDLSLLTESSSSSISQAELIERDELLLPPPPPPAELASDSDTDQQFQRAAVEVTTKAVQEAIQIVRDSGAGEEGSYDEIQNSDQRNSLQLDVEVPTTEESTYAEMAINDSDHASYAYENGLESNGAVNDALNLISFEEYDSVPTPNSAQPVNSNSGSKVEAFSEDQNGNGIHVSDDLSLFLDNLGEMSSNKPTIVINSPDSAHHTNGSSDVSGPDLTDGEDMADRTRGHEKRSNKVDRSQRPTDQSKVTSGQSNYRQGAAKTEVAAMREEYAAIKIQAGVRGFLDRQHVKRIREETKDHRSEV